MNKPKILVIGMGVVGTNVTRSLITGLNIAESPFSVHIYDKYIEDFQKNEHLHYDVAFICVDTPATEDTPCDLTEVYSALAEHDADVFVLKSTVLPGTTDLLREASGQPIIFSPEYEGSTQHCNNFDFDYTILGGNKQDCIKVVQLLQKVNDGRHQFRITDAKTAELAKYMENCYLATKVSFCNQFYDIAQQEGVSYEDLRELFIMDPRVNPSHTFVYKDQPYWDSHCLNKDVAALAEKYDAELIKDIIAFNEKRKPQK